MFVNLAHCRSKNILFVLQRWISKDKIVYFFAVVGRVRSDTVHGELPVITITDKQPSWLVFEE